MRESGETEKYVFPCGWGPEKMFDVPQMKVLRKIRMQHKNFKKLKSKFRSRKLRDELVRINPKTSDIESVEILKSRYYPHKSLDEWVEYFRPFSEFDEDKWEGFVRTIRDQQISGLHSEDWPLTVGDYLDRIAPPRFQSFSLLKAIGVFFFGFIVVFSMLWFVDQLEPDINERLGFEVNFGFALLTAVCIGLLSGVDPKFWEHEKLRNSVSSNKKWDSFSGDCARYAILTGADLEITSPLFDLLSPIMKLEYSVFGQVSSTRTYVSCVLANEYDLQRFDNAGHCVESAAKIAFSSLWSTAEEHIGTCSHCNETALEYHLKAGELTLCISCFRDWTKPFNEKNSEFDSDWEFRHMNSDLCLCSQNLEEFATQGMIEQYVHDGLLVKKERDRYEKRKSKEASARARAARRLAETMQQCLSCSESFPKEGSNNQQYCSKCVVKRNYCQGIRGDRNQKCSKLNYKHWHCTVCDYIFSSYVGNCGCDEG